MRGAAEGTGKNLQHGLAIRPSSRSATLASVRPEMVDLPASVRLWRAWPCVDFPPARGRR